MSGFDVIVIGAGHNGLVAAAYLAKAGKNVLVLERRNLPGGTLVAEEFDGFKAEMVNSGTLLPDIIKALDLARFSTNLSPSAANSAYVSVLSESARLVITDDLGKTSESIRHYSEKDAATWPEFLAFMSKATSFLNSTYRTLMPRLPNPDLLTEGKELVQLGFKLRSMGRKDMLDIIRVFPMTAAEFVDEWFESEEMKAAVASLGIHNVTLGVMSAGTAFNLIHNWLNRGGLAHRYIGQAEKLTSALVNAAKAYGVEIRLQAEVEHINVENGQSTGVTLTSGEEIAANAVLSSIDPKRTFLSLVGPRELPPTFVWNVQSIKMRGSTAKIHLGVKALPEGLSPFTTYVIAPTLEYLEKAYDGAKYGEISERPYLEVTTSENVVSVHFQFAPYALKHGTWNTKRETVENLAIIILSEYFPDLNSAIKTRRTITPYDLESTYALTEGDLNHGQIMLDQSLFMRPVPGWSNHKTPIKGLYLGGNGVHAGGGISGASGRNAAMVVVRES